MAGVRAAAKGPAHAGDVGALFLTGGVATLWDRAALDSGGPGWPQTICVHTTLGVCGVGACPARDDELLEPATIFAAATGRDAAGDRGDMGRRRRRADCDRDDVGH